MVVVSYSKMTMLWLCYIRTTPWTSDKLVVDYLVGVGKKTTKGNGTLKVKERAELDGGSRDVYIAEFHWWSVWVVENQPIKNV